MFAFLSFADHAALDAKMSSDSVDRAVLHVGFVPGNVATTMKHSSQLKSAHTLQTSADSQKLLVSFSWL